MSILLVINICNFFDVVQMSKKSETVLEIQKCPISLTESDIDDKKMITGYDPEKVDLKRCAYLFQTHQLLYVVSDSL